MRWKVGTKKKSLLERLVNIDEGPVETVSISEPLRTEEVAVAEPEEFEMAPVSPVSLEEELMASITKNPKDETENNAWKSIPIHSAEAEEMIEEYEDIPEPVAENSHQSETTNEKYFDILDRAKLEDEDDKMKIEYTIPKRVYPDYVPSIEYKAPEINVDMRSEPRLDPISAVMRDEPTFYERITLDEEPLQAEQEVQELAPEILNITYPEFQVVVQSPIEETLEAPIIESIVVNEEPIIVTQEVVEQPVITNKFEHDKIIFPEEYFYAKNGNVIKNVQQLRDGIQTMDDDTYNHHAVSRGVNDFANWIKHVLKHDECADKLSTAEDRKGVIQIIDSYL